MKPKSNLFVAVSLFALHTTAFAGAIYKVNNTDNLNLVTSWSTVSGLQSPNPSALTAADTWYFNQATMLGSKSVALGGDLTIAGLAVDYATTNSSNDVAIAAGNKLTLSGGALYGSGVNGAGTMYSATGILLNRGTGGTLTIDANVALAATQTWVASRAITVNGALDLGASNLSLNYVGGTSAFNGVIGGTGKITKFGGGTLAVNAANTFSGGFQLGPDAGGANIGVVVAGNAAAFGTGTLTIRGTQLQSSVAGLTIANPVSVGVGGFRLGGAYDFTISNAVTLDNVSRSVGNYGTATITLGGINLASGTGAIAAFDQAGVGGWVNVSGPITGAGKVSVTAGNAAFNGVSTFTGGTTVSGGKISGTGTIPGAVAISGGSIALAGGATTASLTFPAGVTITNAPLITFIAAPVAATVYDVFTYGSGTVTGGANLASPYRGTIVNDTVNQKYTFTLGAQNQTRTWNTTTGIWDGTGTNAVWLEGDNRFFNGDSAIFGNVATDSTVTISGTVNASGFAISNASNTYAFNGGSVSGTAQLVKTGAGTAALATRQSFTGGTVVNGGVLNLTGGGGAAGTIRSTATVNTGGILRFSTGDATGYGTGTDRIDTLNIAGGTLDVNTTANQTLGNATINLTGGSITGIAGSNFDFFQGASTLNSLASATTSTISGVSLAPLRQGSTTFTVADGSAAVDLRIDSVLRLAPSGGDPAGAVLTKAGPGLLQLTAVNNLSRPFSIAAGTLEIAGAGQIGAGNYTLALANNGVLSFASSAAQSITGIVSGTGSLAKSGTGVLTLTASNSYTGPTTITGGTLRVDGSLAASSTVTVSGTGNLSGNGFVDGAVTLNAGGGLSNGDAFGSTLTMASVNFTSTGAINIFELQNYTGNAPLTSTGNLVVSGGAGSITVNLPATALGAGVYHLIGSPNTLANASQFVLGTQPALGNRQTGALKVNPGYLDYQVTGINPIWTGALNGAWTTAVQPSPKNWVTTVPTDFITGDVVTFDDSASGTTAVTIAASVTPASVAFNNSALNYTFSGAGGIAGATTALAKMGTGTVTLGTPNTYGGGTTLTEGKLILGNASALGTGGLVLGGGTLGGTGTIAAVVSGTGPLNVDTGSIQLNGVNTFTGAINLTSAALTIGGAGQLGSGTYSQPIANDGALIYSSSANQLLSGVISGVGVLNKGGASTLALSVTNTYTGGTTVDGGILDLTGGGGASGTIRGSVTVNPGGSLRLSTGDATGYAGGANSLTTINLNGGNLQVNLPTSVANETLGSAVVNMIGGNITGVANSNLDFFGGGSSLNTYASATTSTISGTAIDLRQAPGVTFTVAQGTTASGVDLEISSLLTNKAPAGGLPGTGTNYGSNPLIKDGSGTLKITGLANNYTGNTTVIAGTLDLTAGSIYNGAFNNTSIVTVNTGGLIRVADFSYNDGKSFGQLADYAARRVINGGTLEITAGTHSTGNDFTVTATGGTFRYAPAVTTDTLTLAGNANSNIPISGAANFDTLGNIVVNEIVEGTGSIVKTGAATLTLNGLNTYTGDTVVNAGTFQLAANAQLALVIGTSGTNNKITGSGTAILAGDLNLDLAAASTTSGSSWSLVDVGTLQETFASTFTLVGFSKSGAIHTKVAGTTTWTFSENTGLLTVNSGGTGYSAFAATNAPGQTAGQDYDNDGVSNAVEYILGGSASTQDSGKLPTVAITGGNLVFTFKRAQASKTADVTVAIEVGTTLGAWPVSYTVGNDTASSTPGVTVTPNGDGTDTITLTVAQAPDAKKFARLNVKVN